MCTGLCAVVCSNPFHLFVGRLQRLAIVLLTLHYMVETLFHFSRLVKYHGREVLASRGYKLWKIFFLSVRILTVIISTLALWFGLGREATKTSDEVDETAEAWPKQFNTPFFRSVRSIGVGVVGVAIQW